MPSVVMKEGTRRRVVTMPLTSPTTMPEREEGGHDPPGAVRIAFGQPGRGDDDGGDQRADRQVELAGDDDEHLPRGQDHQRRRALEKGEEDWRVE